MDKTEKKPAMYSKKTCCIPAACQPCCLHAVAGRDGEIGPNAFNMVMCLVRAVISSASCGSPNGFCDGHADRRVDGADSAGSGTPCKKPGPRERGHQSPCESKIGSRWQEPGRHFPPALVPEAGPAALRYGMLLLHVYDADARSRRHVDIESNAEGSSCRGIRRRRQPFV